MLNSRVAHGMHLVLSMCTGNAVVTKDPTRARKLDKGRTDGPQAMAQAFSIALRTKETSGAYAEDSFKFV